MDLDLDLAKLVLSLPHSFPLPCPFLTVIPFVLLCTGVFQHQAVMSANDCTFLSGKIEIAVSHYQTPPVLAMQCT